MVTYPSYWEFRELKEFKKDSFWLMPATPQYQINGVPYITSKNIKNGIIDFEDTDKISEECFRHLSRNRNISNGDILITMIGTIGEVAIVETERKFYGQNIYLLRLDSDKLVNKYFYYYISSPPIKESLTSNKNGSTQGYIKAGAIECLLTPRPPLSEQRAIASVLSDFDEHIDNLTELIEKKKAIRDGALEDLVSGRTRLDGFNGEWENCKVGDFLEFKNGLNKGKEFFGIGTPIINYMDVYKSQSLTKEKVKGKVELSSDEIKRFEAKENDVFFTRTSETPEEVGISSVLLENINNCVFSGFVLRGRPKNKLISPEYCQFCFLIKKVRNDIIKNCTYTTRALTNGKQLSEIELYIPSDIKEQQAISSVLTAMDEEIESLEIEKAKMIQIRKGAMDDLLTGRVRLKV